MSACWVAVRRGAAWSGTTPRALPADGSFPVAGQSMRLRLRPQLSPLAPTTGTATPRPGVRPGRQIQTSVTAMRLGPLTWLPHRATTTGTATPRRGVRPGRQIRALVMAAGDIGATTDIADANIQAAPKTRLKIVST